MQLIIKTVLFFAFTLPLFAQDLIVLPDDGIRPVIQAMSTAQKSIDIAIYRLDHTEVMDALIQAKGRGVTVRVILNPPTPTCCMRSQVDLTQAWSKLKENQKTADTLREHGIDVRFANIQNLVLFHIKLMIIDSQTALIATFNMNQSGFSCGRNFGHFMHDSTDVTALTRYFNTEFEGIISPTLPSHNLCIHENRQRVFIMLYLIQAKKTLDLYQASLLDPYINSLLHLMAETGIKIRILFTPDLFGQDETAQFRKALKDAGVEFRYMKSPYVHAKLILRDDGQMLITSCNFWEDGLDHSRELSAIIDDPQSMIKAKNTFEKDWDSASLDWIAENTTALE